MAIAFKRLLWFPIGLTAIAENIYLYYTVCKFGFLKIGGGGGLFTVDKASFTSALQILYKKKMERNSAMMDIRGTPLWSMGTVGDYCVRDPTAPFFSVFC